MKKYTYNNLHSVPMVEFSIFTLLTIQYNFGTGFTVFHLECNNSLLDNWNSVIPAFHYYLYRQIKHFKTCTQMT